MTNALAESCGTCFETAIPMRNSQMRIKAPVGKVTPSHHVLGDWDPSGSSVGSTMGLVHCLPRIALVVIHYVYPRILVDSQKHHYRILFHSLATKRRTHRVRVSDRTDRQRGHVSSFTSYSLRLCVLCDPGRCTADGKYDHSDKHVFSGALFRLCFGSILFVKYDEYRNRQSDLLR